MTYKYQQPLGISMLRQVKNMPLFSFCMLFCMFQMTPGSSTKILDLDKTMLISVLSGSEPQYLFRVTSSSANILTAGVSFSFWLNVKQQYPT